MKLWRTIGPEDSIIPLGFDPGEYSLNLGPIAAGDVWLFTGWSEPYGHLAGEFRHRVRGNYHVVRGDLDLTLAEIIPRLAAGGFGRLPNVDLPGRRNTPPITRDVLEGSVDVLAFH